MPTMIDLTEFFASLRGDGSSASNGDGGVVGKVRTELETFSSDAADAAGVIANSGTASGETIDLGTATFGTTGTPVVNFMIGGAGNQVLVGREGVDVILGSAGVDTVDYSYVADGDAGVFVDLANRFSVAGAGDVDILGSIENVVGTGNADVLLGNAFNNVFNGNGGGDFIYGRAGVDVAQFTGIAEDYTVGQTADMLGITVSDGTSTTVLYGIELLQFQGESNDGQITCFKIGTGGAGGNDGSVIARDDGDNPDPSDTLDPPAICVDEGDSITIDVLSNDEFVGFVAMKLTGLEGAEANLGEDGLPDGTFTVDGTYGTLTIDFNNTDANGEATVTYQTDARSDALANGETGQEAFEYNVAGGDKADIYIQVKGTNDDPVCFPVEVKPECFDECVDKSGGTALQSETGFFLIQDVDSDAAGFTLETSGPTISPIDTVIPQATLDTWTEDFVASFSATVQVPLNPANFPDDVFQITYGLTFEDFYLDFLAEGQTVEISYQVTVNDGDGGELVKEVVFKACGANDRPDISGPIVRDVCENLQDTAGEPLLIELLDNASDVDTIDTLTATVTSEELPAGVTDNGDGTISFDPGTAYDYLELGQSVDIVVNFDVTDSSGAANDTASSFVTITVIGKNDQPEVADVCIGDKDDTAAPDSAQDNMSGNVYEDCGLGNLNDDGKTFRDPGNQFAAVSGDALVRGDEAADVSQATPGIASYDIGGTSNATDVDDNDTLSITSVSAIPQDGGSDLPILIVEQPVADAGVTTIDGTYGVLHLEANGAYTYALYQDGDANYDNVATLSQGQTAMETFQFTVSDDSGATTETDGEPATTTALLKFTVVGSNDEPTVTDSVGSVQEDVGVDGDMLIATGTADITDIDDETHSVTVEDNSNLGTLVPVINSDGDVSWTYSIDNTIDAVQKLGDGESFTETFTITVDDGTEKACATVEITINGTNDQPTITDICVGSAFEDGVPRNVFEDGGVDGHDPTSAFGSLTDGAVDIDSTDVVTFASAEFKPEDGEAEVGGLNANGVFVVRGEYGALRINPENGNYRYKLYPTEDKDGNMIPRGESLNCLAEGEIAIEEFCFTVMDDSGTLTAISDPAMIKFTIIGTNDEPTVDVGEICLIEDLDAVDGVLTDTGPIAITDVDKSDDHTVTVQDNSLVGEVTVSQDPETGEWSYTYTVDNTLDAVQCLGKDDTLEQTFTLLVNDGTATVEVPLTVTLKGTNGAPEVDDVCVGSDTIAEGPDAVRDTSGNVYEDCGLGALSSDGKTFIQPGPQYSIVQGDALITEGQTADTMANPFPGFQANDIGGSVNASDEDKDALRITDVKPSGSDVATVVTAGEMATVMGTYGTLYLNDDGSYTYALFFPEEAGYDQLNMLSDGEVKMDTFEFSVTDDNGGSDTAQLKFTVVGSNDEPSITASEGSVVEDMSVSLEGNLEAEGTMAITDIDAGDTHSVTGFVGSDNAVGTFDAEVVDGQVEWTYSVPTADTTIQELGLGETLVISYEVTISDGIESACETVTITITGTNDTPTVDTICIGGTVDPEPAGSDTVDMSGNVYEDCGLGPDNIQFASVRGDALVVGDEALDTPADSGDNLASLDVGGAANASDIDEGDLLSIVMIEQKDGDEEPATVPTTGTVTVNGTYGTLSIAANGGYTYTLFQPGDANYGVLNALAQGQEVPDEFVITISDDSGAEGPQDGEPATTTATIKFNVIGTNDKPLIDKLIGEVTQVANADDASVLVATGKTPIDDVDEGDEHVVVDGSLTGADTNFGEVTNVFVNDDGELEYTYKVSDGAIQQLDDGDSETDTFTVDVFDGTETVTVDICVKINGTNDAPTADKIIFSGNEDALAGGTMFNLLQEANAADVDTNDTDGNLTNGELQVDPDSLTGTFGLTLGTDTACDLQIDLPIEAMMAAGLVTLEANGELSVPPALATALQELMEAGDTLTIEADFDITDGTATIQANAEGADICVDIDGVSADIPDQPDYGCGEGQIMPAFLIPDDMAGGSGGMDGG